MPVPSSKTDEFFTSTPNQVAQQQSNTQTLQQILVLVLSEIFPNIQTVS